MTNWPRITIVTPTKNSERHLEETIRSVIEQEYPNLEYIIIDGLSTDGTIDIIKRYEKHISYWESSSDKTMYEAVAKGFDRATGDVFAWINSDDLYEPGALIRVGRHFAGNPDDQVIYFEDTVEKDGWRFPNRPQPDGVSLGDFLAGHILYQDGVFFRRSAYEGVSGLNHSLKYAGDFDLWLRMSRKFRFKKMSGHASCFRLRPGQLSMSDWDRYTKECRQCADSFRSTLSLAEIALAKSSRGLRFKRLLSKRSRKRLWPIEKEELPWPPVLPATGGSLKDCRCPVCGNYPDRLLFSTPDTRFGDRRVWRIYECGDCSLSFTFPKPSVQVLQELYEKSYSGNIKGVHPSPSGFYGLYQGKTIYSHRSLMLFRLLSPAVHLTLGMNYDDIVPVKETKDANILEVGCFEGRILEYLRGRGFKNLFGVELNKKAASVARSKGFLINSEDVTVSDWPHRKVDAIVLNQVLEHVENPIGFLESISRLLTPGGRIYLSIPNYDSAFIDFYGPVWSHWHIPFHFFTAGPGAVRKIAGKAGLAVEWMKTCTPVHYAYMSDALSRAGLAGFVSHNPDTDDPFFKGEFRRAIGVSVFSRLFLDPFLRGDCLFVKLVKRSSS